MAGTPVRVTVNLGAIAADHLAAHAFLVQAVAGNTGKIYVGGPGMNKTTYVNVYGVVALPSYNTDNKEVALPTFSVAQTLSPNGLAINEIWLDVDDSGDAGLVSFLQV